MTAMDLTLNRFVHALRAADVEVSPAETLDALAVVQQVGLSDRRLLQDALRLTLAKSVAEKDAFDLCFPTFFDGLPVHTRPRQSVLGQIDAEEFLAEVRRLAHPALTEVVGLVLRDDRTELSRRVVGAVDRDALDAMQHLRDKPPLINAGALALGLPNLDGLRGSGGAVASTAAYVRQYLTQQLKDYVDTQYRLTVDATGQRSLLKAALSANLQQLPPGYHAEVERVVEKLADQLSRRYRRKRRRDHRGQLDIRRMLRRNVAYDGAPVNIYWRRQKREKASIFLVCDISNSVAQIARFLLLLLYKLGAVLPGVRSFAFSSQLGEITALMKNKDHNTAIETAVMQHGRGTTDYGRAMHDLQMLAARDINRKSVLVFLGDARSNHFPSRADLFRSMAKQAGQAWWLTPETQDRWDTGDCVLHEYAPHCRAVLTCNKLADVERFAEQLVQLATDR
jgi:uncharacterized protein